ncbi:MAG TPA: threonine synthase [Chloroflexota bacterium]|nr:threonine synthase [Chloroflexota bacterium]
MVRSGGVQVAAQPRPDPPPKVPHAPGSAPEAFAWQPWAERRGLRCINCQQWYPLREIIYRCAKCDDLLDVVYPRPPESPQTLKRRWHRRRSSDKLIDRSGVWRFREMLPFYDRESQLVTYPEGNTPLLDAPRSAAYAGVRRLRFKHLGFNPTGSFKDYGMAAGVTQARILGMQAVACASTGNTSASMAAYAARAGLVAIVLVPEGGVSFPKLSQSLDYGALTLQIRGDFDAAMTLLQEIGPGLGIYILNSVNPFRLEGQKSVMLELLEQCAWQAPDRIVVPGGNLGNSGSYGKALRELDDLGLLSKRPHITIVQARGAAPLYNAFHGGHPETLERVHHARTLATAIKIGSPVSWKKARRAVDWSDGWVTSVDEQDIADAKAIIGADGIGCEPASATTLGAIRRLAREGTDSRIDPDEDIIAILTGNVLKDADYTLRYHSSELYEEFTTETVMTHRGTKLASRFANPPAVVDATAEALVAAIRARLSDRERGASHQ